MLMHDVRSALDAWGGPAGRVSATVTGLAGQALPLDIMGRIQAVHRRPV